MAQVGTRSGLLFFSITRPAATTVMYFQNLSSLNRYCEQTKCSSAEVVGGQWPEIGFSLPATKENFLPKGKKFVISDAYVALSDAALKTEAQTTTTFLNLLAAVYLKIPKPQTKPQDWPAILEKGLTDLLDSPGCWSQNNGHRYFNAYVCDYKTPPEIMVQLAVILPLVDYSKWRGEQMDTVSTIVSGLPAFYNEKAGTIMRWLPSAEKDLDGSEEHKKPMVMDSWYLHHPLLNLSRMAIAGNSTCKKLFLDSIGFAIKVARRFNYEWPVFYNMQTLEIIKEETAPGKGGEQDVAGLYVHIMLQAFEITGERRYLSEAERAAKKLEGKSFELFYQANNTAFGAGALLRLWKITRKKLYLDLSYLCLANIFKNVQLWECDYGYAKNLPTFFALFPLSNAPYTAVYEEQEVFCAFHDYLQHGKGEDILPSVRLLLNEFIRFLIHRAVYYYPPMLPDEMLADCTKTGELDRTLWIALEDLHDGWGKSGQVGQEVYGAGNAFGIVPRHYYKIPGESFMIFTEYPASKIIKKASGIYINLMGDERITCKLSIIPAENKRIPATTVMVKGEELKQSINSLSYREYEVAGNAKIKISW